MMRITVILAVFLFPLLASAQGEMLLLKKKGRVHTTYFKGSPIIFDAGMGWQEGYIADLRNDSVFLVQYRIRQVLTTLGTFRPDTIGTYYFSTAVEDIQKLGAKQTGFNWQAAGGTLFGGGALLTTAGLLTWVLSTKDSRYYVRPEFVITSAALAATGFILMQAGGDKKYVIGNKYSLQFIATK